MKKIIPLLITFFLTTSFLTAEITPNLSDKNATDNAKHLYKYLKDMYGKKVITGIMENAWNDSFIMLDKVNFETDKYAALTGFDFMNYTGMGYSVKNQQVERAINFWNGQNYRGKTITKNQGIVSFMWHWRDPMATGSKTGDFNTDKAEFRIPYDTETDTWKTDTAEYKNMMRDLDVIAKELLKLQFADVPVLWRPMHEGAGNVGLYNKTGKAWFWWGAGNSKDNKVLTDVDVCGECYIALWKLMYNYFVETKGIHNLIWVWNGQNAKFYPGAEYVDIIGNDIYNNPKNYSAGKAAFDKVQSWDDTKIVTLSECGVMPSMTNIQKDGAWWSYFMVWNDSKNQKTDAEGQFWYGERYNPSEHKLEVFNSDIAITLDELPDLTTY